MTEPDLFDKTLNIVGQAFYRRGWSLWVDPYKLIVRPFFFRMDAEKAHHRTMNLLELLPAWLILFLCKPRQVFP